MSSLFLSEIHRFLGMSKGLSTSAVMATGSHAGLVGKQGATSISKVPGGHQLSLLQEGLTQKISLLFSPDQLHAAIYFGSVFLTVFLIIGTVGRLRKAFPGSSRAYLARQRAGFANRHSRRPARWEHLLR